MTIIEPNKKQTSYRFIFTMFFSALFLGAIIAVLLYNNVVVLRNQLREGERTLQTLNASNTGMKNDMYAILDARRAKEKLTAFSFVLEKNPEFISIDPAPVATNL